MAQFAIKGHSTRGKEVIQLLEMLGADRLGYKDTFVGFYYYIECDAVVSSDECPIDAIVYTLEEFEEKFPYKVGDKVTLDNKLCTIIWMCWECDNMYYQVQGIDTMFTKKVTTNDLQPYKEKIMETLNNKINIAELLKDCPSGMELDCVMYENVYFDKIYDEDCLYQIKCYTIEDEIRNSINFTKYGEFTTSRISKCVIFPKGKTTWEGFQRPFKDGEIVACDNPYINSSEIFIFKDKKGCNILSNCYLMLAGDELNIEERAYYVTRHATEEEKAKLFQAIKDNGYKWNAKTKTLEKLVEPKFKVGDKIKHRLTGEVYMVLFVLSNGYGGGVYDVADTNEIGKSIDIKEQDDYELVPNKFDITTLKPFESRVLVRDYYHQCWKVSFFGYFDKFMGKFDTVRGVYIQCIPYEGNEHLLGKTDDCNEYFKTWE